MGAASHSILYSKVTPTGFEPPAATRNIAKDLGESAGEGAAESGAVFGDPDLQRVIDAWPNLPPDIKVAVLNLVVADHVRG
jgi:hypothetical protein